MGGSCSVPVSGHAGTPGAAAVASALVAATAKTQPGAWDPVMVLLLLDVQLQLPQISSCSSSS